MSFVQRISLRFVAALMVVSAAGIASAAPEKTCEDRGMTTWAYQSGVYTQSQGVLPHAACKLGWDAYAEVRSASGNYWYTVNPVYLDLVPAHLYTCYTCTREIVTAPDTPTLLAFDMGDAGDIAGDLVGGVAIRIERHDDFGAEKRSVYLVDVMSAAGRSQVLVDGDSGEATALGTTADAAQTER